MPQVPIDPARSAVILFDMLNDYLKPSDPELARVIAAKRIEENTARLLTAARAAGMLVCYTNSYRRADDGDHIAQLTDADMGLQPWSDGPGVMPPKTGRAGTPGAQVVDELTPEPHDLVIPKLRWSAFAGTYLDLLLRSRDVNTLLLTGGGTDVGIAATAYCARDLGYHLIFVRDCCHSEQPGAQDFFMDRLLPRMGRVMSLDLAIELIARPAIS
jgi:ureidoacrylate peracid hydrolase